VTQSAENITTLILRHG